MMPGTQTTMDMRAVMRKTLLPDMKTESRREWI